MSRDQHQASNALESKSTCREERRSQVRDAGSGDAQIKPLTQGF